MYNELTKSNKSSVLYINPGIGEVNKTLSNVIESLYFVEMDDEIVSRIKEHFSNIKISCANFLHSFSWRGDQSDGIDKTEEFDNNKESVTKMVLFATSSNSIFKHLLYSYEHNSEMCQGNFEFYVIVPIQVYLVSFEYIIIKFQS